MTDRKALLLLLAAAGGKAIAAKAAEQRAAVAETAGRAHRPVRARGTRAAARGLARVIVLDASVLIGHLDGRDGHHERARDLLAANAGTSFGASSISLAETLVGPARSGKLGVARDAIARLAVEELAFGEDAPARLAVLRAETGLKLPDCCVPARRPGSRRYRRQLRRGPRAERPRARARRRLKAERVGFEPTRRVNPAHAISSRAP